jgi:2-hydroxychromene-2-carboxylate isomerase
LTEQSHAGPELEFFIDFMSPTAYLAHTQLAGLVARTGARVRMRPMSTLRLHALTGNSSPMAVPNKAQWAIQDLIRHAARYGVPFRVNPNWPLKIVDALHGALVAEAMGVLDAYAAVLFPAVWADAVNVDDRVALGACLDAAGLDAGALIGRLDEPQWAERLEANTQEAADRGAFGSPTFFVGSELHFGQDRLDFVEAALTASSTGLPGEDA